MLTKRDEVLLPQMLEKKERESIRLISFYTYLRIEKLVETLSGT